MYPSNKQTAADPLRFILEQPQRIDFHGSDQRHCLLRGKLEILGGLPEPWNHLLRLAAIGTSYGPAYVWGCRIMDFRLKPPDPLTRYKDE
jgi:hypothetical protein